MSISIRQAPLYPNASLMVAQNAAVGAIIGALATDQATGATFLVENNSLFAVVDGNLTVAVALPAPGFCSVQVFAVLGDEEVDESDFVVSVQPVVSPDGSKLTVSEIGTLTTADGVWSFGAADPSYPGNSLVLLNGISTTYHASIIEINTGGKAYIYRVNDTWSVWGSGFVASTTAP
jgi:hypothetical protein